MDKSELRAQIRAQKRALTNEQISACSARLAARLFALPTYRNARSLYGYLSYNQEVLTLPILRRALEDGKRVAVPKILCGEMVFLWISDLSRIAPGYRGVPEPVDDAPRADDETALVLAPGLAFTCDGGRCGYGGGFYDRFLTAEPHHPTVALCFSFQIVDFLTAEAHDVRVQSVLSEPV